MEILGRKRRTKMGREDGTDDDEEGRIKGRKR